MFMVVRMTLALLPADTGGQGTRLDDRPRELRLELGLPGEDLARGGANITAVKAQADTADHGADVVLAEVCVRASSAALSAVEACVDTRNQGPRFDRGSPRMRLQYLLSVSHDFLPSSRGPTLSLRPGRVKPAQVSNRSPKLVARAG